MAEPQAKTRNDHLPKAGSEDAPGAGDRNRNLHRHGDADPSGWDEAPNIADRPQDTPSPNSTMADRAKAAKSASKKAVSGDNAENKAVAPAKAATKRK